MNGERERERERVRERVRERERERERERKRGRERERERKRGRERESFLNGLRSRVLMNLCRVKLHLGWKGLGQPEAPLQLIESLWRESSNKVNNLVNEASLKNKPLRVRLFFGSCSSNLMTRNSFLWLLRAVFSSGGRYNKERATMLGRENTCLVLSHYSSLFKYVCYFNNSSTSMP